MEKQTSLKARVNDTDVICGIKTQVKEIQSLEHRYAD
jgi:hypothetical protein